ncbi:MAG: protein kinase [Opitutales bacterium]
MGLDRYVALKECLPCDFAARSSDNTTVRAKTQASVEDFEWAKTRFIEEARTLAKFRNVNLLSSNNIFQANGTVYMDSDFIEGINLEDIYVDNKICEEAEVLNVFKGILNGLKEVHSAGLMHRDIKPANIIIRSSDTQPVLIDFGSARMAVSSKTKPLTAMVTQGYAPLEQYYEDGNQGAWTDIYALAGVCYKMITGEKPPEAVARIKRDTIIKLSERYEGKYSGNLLRLLDQCLAVDEEERPQSVDECLAIFDKSFSFYSHKKVEEDKSLKEPTLKKEEACERIPTDEAKDKITDKDSSIPCEKVNVYTPVFSIRGRASRTTYLLQSSILLFLVWFFYSLREESELLGLFFILSLGLASFYGIFLTIRRFHDMGWNPWSLLVFCIPYLTILMIFFAFLVEGDLTANKYGTEPDVI